jgi:hypothetical protein
VLLLTVIVLALALVVAVNVTLVEGLPPPDTVITEFLLLAGELLEGLTVPLVSVNITKDLLAAIE